MRKLRLCSLLWETRRRVVIWWIAWIAFAVVKIVSILRVEQSLSYRAATTIIKWIKQKKLSPDQTYIES